MTTTDTVRVLSSGADDAAKEMKAFSAQAKDTAKQSLGDLERQIRDKPLQAAFIAAGAGLLIGMLFTRRRSSSHYWDRSASPRKRIRMTRRQLRHFFENQVARAGRAWDDVHGSERVRDIGQFLDSQRRRWV